MKKAISILLVLMIAAVFFMGCDDSGTTTTAAVKVGDVLAGGYTVTVVDTLGGYLATRDFDEDEDGTVDEYQTLVSGRFSKSMTWTEDRVYYLLDAVFIGNDYTDDASTCTLTIEAGTLIKGEVSTTNPGVLVITRGSNIIAEGTAAKPIVFTSARDAGSRAAGDWGGIVINGLAPVNKGTDVEGEGSTGYYGGTDASDNSGTLKYVRVEFAGTLFSPDNELNGIAFQGVGSGTTVDYIQVHRNADDGVEFFGGTVNVSHVVVTGAADDSLDWTYGWVGTAQYGVLQQYAGIGDHGFECDNNSSNLTAAPVSDPVIKNFTVIGSDRDDGALFRVGTKATIVNTIITGFGTEGSIDETDSGGAPSTITYEGVLATDAAQADAAMWAAAVTATTATESATLNLPAAALSGANTGSVDVQPTSAINSAGVSLSTNGAAYFGAVSDTDTAPWYEGWTSTPLN